MKYLLILLFWFGCHHLKAQSPLLTKNDGDIVGVGNFALRYNFIYSSAITASWMLHHKRDFIYNIDHIVVKKDWGKGTKIEHPPFLIRLGNHFYYHDGRTRVRLVNIYYKN